jgi:hypothetical protein
MSLPKQIAGAGRPYRLVLDSRRSWSEHLATSKATVLDELTVDSIERYLVLYSSAARADAFLKLVAESGRNDLFWPWVVRNWSGFDAIERIAYSKRFRELRPIWSIEFWTDHDRNAFAALPDPFTAYWGGDSSQRKNCWTTNVEVAEALARGHRGARHPNPVTLSAPLPKNIVCMFLTDRTQVVLFRRPKGLQLFKPSRRR